MPRDTISASPRAKEASRVSSLTGEDLVQMFGEATRLLEENVQAINSLNVFPVPDGDTGTNMFLTLRAVMEAVSRSPDHQATAVFQTMAHGALMGARGNSGVILSQFLRGLARGVEGKETVTGQELASALGQACAMAYKGLSRPVEGTMLTVIREVAEAAQKAAEAQGRDLGLLFEAMTRAAREAVARTPELLPVLRQAGVVDAGGQGLYLILEGARRYLQGEMDRKTPLTMVAPATLKESLPREQAYGYCTEFLVQGHHLDLDKIRERLSRLGDSLLVVGDEATVRVHVHTRDPGKALSLATSLGTLHQVKVDNMQDQHRDFLAAPPATPPAPSVPIATIVVASGEGLGEVFRSLGATVVVPGGQTMNPSVAELLEAVKSASSDQAILLPNNPNIIPAARQVQGLSSKEVAVVSSRSIPQGIAALLAFNVEADLPTNLAAMEAALGTVRTGEVTRAIRSMRWGELEVKKGQAIGLLEGDLVVAGRTPGQVIRSLLLKLNLKDISLVTIYYGTEKDRQALQGTLSYLRRRFPGLEVEVIAGGQPHYNYILSAE